MFGTSTNLERVAAEGEVQMVARVQRTEAERDTACCARAAGAVRARVRVRQGEANPPALRNCLARMRVHRFVAYAAMQRTNQ